MWIHEPDGEKGLGIGYTRADTIDERDGQTDRWTDTVRQHRLRLFTASLEARDSVLQLVTHRRNCGSKQMNEPMNRVLLFRTSS